VAEVIHMLDFKAGELLLLNKPLYWTSFDLVKRVKGIILKKTNIRNIKVGHAGTLDPLATGLMIVCTGAFTKKIEQFTNLNKEYEADLMLGATTPSYDLETPIDQRYEISHISETLLNDALRSFTGTYNQKPPSFSAKFFNGKRAYELARKGRDVDLKLNLVSIYKLEMLAYNKPVLKIRIHCSKGTYIRALARDIGYKLNAGAHLIALKRTAVGDYTLEKAMSLDEFQEFLKLM
jgi:tRNA pseudouridine55 synthase